MTPAMADHSGTKKTKYTSDKKLGANLVKRSSVQVLTVQFFFTNSCMENATLQNLTGLANINTSSTQLGLLIIRSGLARFLRFDWIRLGKCRFLWVSRTRLV
jgi:hypothetical protein